MDISTVKNYIRVDHDEDDGMIALMMEAAEEYIINACGSFDESKARARMIYFAAVQDMYDNRTLIATSTQGYAVSSNFTHMISSLMAQLQTEELMEG